jgi:Cu(I)/Ag(I) efflux system protein CusF
MGRGAMNLGLAAVIAVLAIVEPRLVASHAVAAEPPADAAAVPGVPSPESLPWVDAEVRRVDKSAKKITLRHGPIPNLDMPPMSMVFQVRDPAWLDQYKAGDKVRISADKTGGAYVVMQIEPAR